MQMHSSSGSEGTTGSPSKDDNERRLTSVSLPHWQCGAPNQRASSSQPKEVDGKSFSGKRKDNPLPHVPRRPRSMSRDSSSYEQEHGFPRIVPQIVEVINDSAATPQPAGNDEKEMDAYMSGEATRRHPRPSAEEIERANEVVRDARDLQLTQLLDSSMVDDFKDALGTLTLPGVLVPKARESVESFRQNFLKLQSYYACQVSQKLAALQELGSIENVEERVAASHAKYEAAVTALAEKRARLAALKGEIAELEESIIDSTETKRALYVQCKIDEDSLKDSSTRKEILTKAFEKAEARTAKIDSSWNSLQWMIDDLVLDETERH